MRNQYPGSCYRCGWMVDAGAGHFEKNKGAGPKWRTQHADCAIQWRGKSPSRDEAEAFRLARDKQKA